MLWGGRINSLARALPSVARKAGVGARIIWGVTALSVPAAAAVSTDADEVDTVGGETLTGEIVRGVTDGGVVLLTAKGPVYVPAAQVRKIRKKPPKAAASVDEPKPEARREARGFELAVRAGYARSFGKLSERPGSDASRVFPAEIPLVLDIGVRPLPELYLGGTFRYAFTSRGEAWDNLCRDGVSCSAYGFGLGGALAVHFLPLQKIDPWIMGSVGFAAHQLNATNDDGKLRLAFRGIETRVAVGLDFRRSAQLHLGGFVELGIVDYIDAVGDSEGLKFGREIKDSTKHYWLTIGPRLSWMP